MKKILTLLGLGLFFSGVSFSDSVPTLNCPSQIRLVYSVTNVTTSAYVTLSASLPIDISHLEIFDSSGQTMQIGVGASGSEQAKRIIFPGGQGMIPLSLRAGQRLAIKALSGTASSGEIDLNLCQ